MTSLIRSRLPFCSSNIQRYPLNFVLCRNPNITHYTLRCSLPIMYVAYVLDCLHLNSGPLQRKFCVHHDGDLKTNDMRSISCLPEYRHKVPLVVPTNSDLCLNWRSMELIESWGSPRHIPNLMLILPSSSDQERHRSSFLYCIVKIHIVA
jgi:hypothetical protein